MSPYLFVLMMNIIMRFLHLRAERISNEGRDLPGVRLDTSSILYADDTTLVAGTPGYLEELLHILERLAACLRLKVNQRKTVLLSTWSEEESQIRYLDGTLVELTRETLYLGAELSTDSYAWQEITRRILAAWATWRQLKMFWGKSRVGRYYRLVVWDLVVRAKLAYGLESLVLKPDMCQRIDAFYHKGLRAILGVPSSYIDREWTNARLLEEANRFIPSHQWEQGKKDCPPLQVD